MALEDSALFSKIYGGLIGAAVGDALGGPVEGLDYPEIERLHGRVERMLPYDKAPSEHGQFTNEAGSYTDDTRISLIHCQAILATGGDVTRGDLARAITDYHYQNPGRLERAFIEEYHLKGFYGARKLLYGGQPTNGAIMGNTPLGLLHPADPRAALEVAGWCLKARGCELVLLPGYSPDFNPIELAFSKIKAFVKAVGARTRGALDSAIAAALSTVSLGDVLGWFEHAGVTNHSF